jgi:hypothetical protein
MKSTANLILILALLLSASCSRSGQDNEAASDTAYILDTATTNTPSDTSRRQDTARSKSEGQFKESNSEQGPRTSVGTDTTGKQSHDNNPK